MLQTLQTLKSRCTKLAMNTLRAAVVGVPVLTAATLFPVAMTSQTFAGMGASSATGLLTSPPDELILKDGRIVKGRLLEETDTQYTFEVMIGSITAVRTYSKNEVLGVVRGEETAKAQADTTASATPAAADRDPSAGPSVYVMELKGDWGRDIAVQPIREMLDDAKQHKPDIVVVVIDNKFADDLGNDLSDDQFINFNVFAAEDIEPLFTREVPVNWGYEPRWIIWVKNAMGGAAFLPFNFEEIYFDPSGRMGGLGYLIFNWGTMGDVEVREKQISLQIGHAEGMAIRGGHDPRIIRAMSDMRMELSYKLEGGRPVLFERLPQSPDEILLTDNGSKDEFRDSIDQRVRGETNDALTLKPDVAQTLGISKGTVATLDDLLWELGISRTANLIESRSDRIAERWADSLVRAERQFVKLTRDFADVQVQGDYNERRAARARQISIIEEMIRLSRRYEGVLNPGQYGVPDEATLQINIEQIRQEQIKDRR
jgi:hypothetical protein